MMKYTWNCKNVEVYPVTTINGVEYRDVLHTVHWEYTAEENGDSQTHIDDLHLSLTDMTNFTPYSELNNEIISGWVIDSIGVDKLSEIEYALSKCIIDRATAGDVSETRIIP